MLLWSITTISWNWMDITNSLVRQKHTKRFQWQLWIFGMQWYWASLRVFSITMEQTSLINVTRLIIVQLCTSHRSKSRNRWFSCLFIRATSTKWWNSTQRSCRQMLNMELAQQLDQLVSCREELMWQNCWRSKETISHIWESIMRDSIRSWCKCRINWELWHLGRCRQSESHAIDGIWL